MNKIKSICKPKGFSASGIHCGIKKAKLDLGLIYSVLPAKAAGVFTTNAIKAAPVKICLENLKGSKDFQAVIVNSGNANCANGPQGLKDARSTCRDLAKILVCRPKQILVSSTGIIGKKLAVEKIQASLLELVGNLSKGNSGKCAKAIMTTDTFAKEAETSFKIGKASVNIGLICKGAGMIQPDMTPSGAKHATMLCFITTDINISQVLLNKALNLAVNKSFNKISIDGCMSTNDTVIILANGQAQNKIVSSEKEAEYKIFLKNLEQVCLTGAKMIIQDAEGATKFITIKINSAPSLKIADKCAFAIANSMLFKTACFGSNPNWGRIISALGSVMPNLKENKLEIIINKSKVFKNGAPLKFAKDLIRPKDLLVEINLNLGKYRAAVFTSDLSRAYVDINAEYN